MKEVVIRGFDFSEEPSCVVVCVFFVFFLCVNTAYCMCYIIVTQWDGPAVLEPVR